MTIHLIQSDIVWESPSENCAHLDDLIKEVSPGSLVVLPEMFNTGFTRPSSELVETMDGPTVQWMKNKANALSCTLTGSLMIQEGDKIFNRMLWVETNGSVRHYDKRHLFRMAGEDQHFEGGDQQVIVDWNGTRVCLQICYDLRFPIWSRNRFDQGAYRYDLLVYVANWPSARHHAWKGLLRARAMENIAYCIGVNRVGKDGKGLDYSGGSAVIDPIGHPVQEGGNEEENIQVTIDMEMLKSFREKFPVGMDADRFTIL